MPPARSMRSELRNLLEYGDLSFRDFMELALYHPELGYYTREENPVGKRGDYVTAPTLSPAFSFAIAGLFREFVRRAEGAVCSFVDIGCGDGGLVRSVAAQIDQESARFFGVDRSLSRVPRFLGDPRGPSEERPAPASEEPEEPEELRGTDVTFVRALDEVPKDGCHLLFSNELFDAIPFTRLVRRGEHLHELWVAEREGVLDWTEHEAAPVYEAYFEERGIELAEGQFADISLEWSAYAADVARFLRRGLIVTLDYGFPQKKLFHPRARRFGTAAAYSRHRVHRDLLADPGEQDLTAHINFTDLERAGEREGATTLFFDSMARFLLSIGITEHELFRPAQDVAIASAEEGLELIDVRDEARRLVLPDGIGEDLRVLVQEKGMGEGWSFQKPLW